MDIDFLRFQVQSINNTPSSIIEAIKAVLAALKEEDSYLPKSVEHHFFEETAKTVLEWIGKGSAENMREAIEGIDKIVMEDRELSYPLTDLDPKKKISAHLSYFAEIMSIYLRSNLVMKDYQKLLGNHKVQVRSRKLLLKLYDFKERFTVADILEHNLYDIDAEDIQEVSAKTNIRRTLESLESIGMVKREVEGKRFIYELTPQAHFRRDEIYKKERAEEPPVQPKPRQQSIKSITISGAWTSGKVKDQDKGGKRIFYYPFEEDSDLNRDLFTKNFNESEDSSTGNDLYKKNLSSALSAFEAKN